MKQHSSLGSYPQSPRCGAFSCHLSKNRFFGLCSGFMFNVVSQFDDKINRALSGGVGALGHVCLHREIDSWQSYGGHILVKNSF